MVYKDDQFVDPSLNEEVDIGFIFCDPIKTVDHMMYRKFLDGSREEVSNTTMVQYREQVLSQLQLSRTNIKKRVVIDTDDRALYLPGVFDFFGDKVDLFLKKEYRRTHTYSYSDKVKPFSFTSHYYPHLIEFYEDRFTESPLTRINECVWVGTPWSRMEVGMPDEWVNRKDYIEILTRSGSIKTLGFAPRPEYLKNFRKYKMCLHLNGSGQKCHRFFEALAQNCLLIQQEMDTLNSFPGDFHELTIFRTPYEAIEKINILKSDIGAYKEAHQKQVEIVEKYHSPEYIRKYINELLF